MSDPVDIRIESEDGETGMRQVVITALDPQGEIDLETEYQRILKLLERDWAIPEDEATDG